MPAPPASVTWTVLELWSSGVTAPPSAAFQDHAPLRDPQENGQHLMYAYHASMTDLIFVIQARNSLPIIIIIHK